MIIPFCELKRSYERNVTMLTTSLTDRSVAICKIIIVIIAMDITLLVGLYNPREQSGIYQFS